MVPLVVSMNIFGRRPYCHRIIKKRCQHHRTNSEATIKKRPTTTNAALATWWAKLAWRIPWSVELRLVRNQCCNDTNQPNNKGLSKRKERDHTWHMLWARERRNTTKETPRGGWRTKLGVEFGKTMNLKKKWAKNIVN